MELKSLLEDGNTGERGAAVVVVLLLLSLLWDVVLDNRCECGSSSLSHPINASGGLDCERAEAAICCIKWERKALEVFITHYNKLD
jgi:hypothetical protein